MSPVERVRTSRNMLSDQSYRVEGINDAQIWSQRPVRDTSFGLQRRIIEDRCARSLTSCTRSSGHRKERLELLGDWQTLANGCVDKVEYFGIGVAGV